MKTTSTNPLFGKRTAPRNERSFPTPMNEIVYLCRKIEYWLYHSTSPKNAYRFYDRLENVLPPIDDCNMAIIYERGWSLHFELSCEWAQAIRHRENEICLIVRLHETVVENRQRGALKKHLLQGNTKNDLHIKRKILTRLKNTLLSSNFADRH